MNKEKENNKELMDIISAMQQQLENPITFDDSDEDTQANISVTSEKLDISMVDTEKNYTFVMLKWEDKWNSIKEAFPNAKFCPKNENINANSTDMVIFMTNFLSHDVFYGVREQCRVKGIPFVYCPGMHTDKIKETILLCSQNK